MTIELINIIFIAPYLKMEQDVKAAFSQLHLPNIRYKVYCLTPDEECKILEEDCDVVISRGLTAAMYRNMKLPTVELSTSGYDLIMAVRKGIQLFESNHLAVVGPASMLFDTKQFPLLFPGVQVECYQTDSREEVERQVRRALDDGATALIGGRSVHELAMARGIPCIMVESGRESIIKSIEIAVQFVESTRAERAEADRIAKIMDYSFGGIISTDTLGQISDLNRKASVIFGVRREEVLGQHISRVIPGIQIDTVIGDGARLLDEVYRVGSNLVSLNCVPIEGEKMNSGAVITCQEAQEVHKTEAKIRKKSLQKGFVSHYHFDDIICQDTAMLEAVNRAKRFSNSQANVLIYGETGVGKELFAQSIHSESDRRNGPFVAINCAALPEPLLESELFGYVQGAFTGAAKSGKVVLFEAAHRGTIFLDEIGDLPLTLQSRLLRVLQEKEIVRLGDDHVIPIDIRVVSATNKNLEQEVLRGNFRSDLMYRLDVLKLTLPPLRERKQDILPLLWQFLSEYCERDGREQISSIDPKAAQLLQTYPWLGNVRQLRNIAQRLAILCDGVNITEAGVAEALELHTYLTTENDDLDEADRIHQALLKTGYRRAEAAKLLGMDRSTLWRKMKKYGQSGL